MKKVNDSYFVSKLNESQDNQTKRLYCELIDQLKNFDSEYRIEKFYHQCKIYYESLNIFPTLEIADTTIAIINYFLNVLNYSPLPKTVFYLNSILLMTFKLLLSSNNISNLIILYSKYLSLIKDNKIKEIIKENKSVKYTKNKIINLFKEGKKKFQEQLNTRKIFFSILIAENKFQEGNKIEVLEFFDRLESQVKNALNKNRKEDYIINDFFDFEDDNDIWYVVSTDWLHKFLAFKKFFDKICKDIEGYKYFLFTGFDANNVILNIINNYSTIKNNIVSYIGPIINKNSISCLDILRDPNYENNNFILSKGFTYIDERLYLDLSDFFGIDFELKREKKYFDVKFKEIMILSNILRKKDVSSICKEIISFEDDMTYEKLKSKIIRCIKYKYDIDFSTDKINIYVSEYNNKNCLNEQNFFILNGYGLNLINNLYIKCTKLNSDNFDFFFKNEKVNNNIFIYFEILEKEMTSSFIISTNENICSLCNKEIIDNILFCDENEKCLNKYCSSECKYKDKKHINFHIEINKYFIQNISIEKLLDKNISFSKESKMGLTGLINTKNNCYINSVLQCLSNCFQFTKYFLSNLYLDDLNTHDSINNGEISKYYKKFLKNLWKKNLENTDADIFRDIFTIKNSNSLERYEQNDAGEFLIFLLDNLHDDLNRVNNKEYIKLNEKLENETQSQAALRWWKNHLRRNDSIIVDLFHGQIRNRILCNECKYNSYVYDPFMILPLNIPQGKISITFKYFGYNFGDYHEFNLNLNEDNNNYKQKIIDMINNYFNDDKKSNKNNKKKKINKKKNKNENNKNISGDKNEPIIQEANIISIELILLTKDKKIYKVIDNENDINLLYYINQGFELVAYEKEDTSENIYFYLVHYTNEYFLWIYPYVYENILFQYPLPLSIKPEKNVFNIYQKIYQYIYELTNCEIILNNDINYENEKKIGFIVYINSNKEQKHKGSICSQIYNYFKTSNQKLRILEKFNIDTKYSEIKEKLNININRNKKLILNIDLLINIDEKKLSIIEKNSFKKLSCKKQINIYDCLDLFISEEKIEENIYYCSKCKKRNKFSKKMDLFKEPYYLIIHLNRYKMNRTMKDIPFLNNKFNNIKNDCFIDFPIQNLDLTEYFIGNDQKKKYNLIGVINHYGESFNGHYTAYCLNRNNWFCFDDENITEINKNSIVSDSAFILFYQKVN